MVRVEQLAAAAILDATISNFHTLLPLKSWGEGPNGLRPPSIFQEPFMNCASGASLSFLTEISPSHQDRWLTQTCCHLRTTAEGYSAWIR